MIIILQLIKKEHQRKHWTSSMNLMEVIFYYL